MQQRQRERADRLKEVQLRRELAEKAEQLAQKKKEDAVREEAEKKDHFLWASGAGREAEKKFRTAKVVFQYSKKTFNEIARKRYTLTSAQEAVGFKELDETSVKTLLHFAKLRHERVRKGFMLVQEDVQRISKVIDKASVEWQEAITRKEDAEREEKMLREEREKVEDEWRLQEGGSSTCK